MEGKIIAIIPARKGSKRLLGKNKKLLNGKPLVCYSIELALECSYIDEVIVSTDDDDIMELVVEYSLKSERIKLFKRPEYLSRDNTTMDAVLEDIVKKLGYKPYVIILLQPTSPLRTELDVRICLNMYKGKTVISVDQNGNRNGAVYVYPGNYFDFDHYEMSNERSIDIDYEDDFERVKEIMEEL